MDAATTTAPQFVLVVDGEEANRYDKKASANKAAARARAKGQDAEVLAADNWDNQDGVTLAPTGDAEHDALEASGDLARVAAGDLTDAERAEVDADEAEHLAAVEAREAAEDAQRDGADLAAAEVVEEAEEVTAEAAVKAEARKLTLAERRALSAPLHEAARRVLAELDLSAPGLENVTARDAEACVALWMWYLPNGKQWDDAL